MQVRCYSISVHFSLELGFAKQLLLNWYKKQRALIGSSLTCHKEAVSEEVSERKKEIKGVMIDAPSEEF